MEKAENRAKWDKLIIKQCDFDDLAIEFLDLVAEEITKKSSKSTSMNKAKMELEQTVELLASHYIN